MPMPKHSRYLDLQESIVQNWRNFMDNMETSLNMLDKEIDEAAQMQSICTSEWCEATEHVIDELGNSLFSISEPRWGPEEDSLRIKELRKRLHDLYARYKAASGR
ncbi:MAG: hypothetical protein JW932_06120 [Deltaproteobacteria bacterium]|nr:hypothetical protein [Deltaproteobacteria bacterium]